MMQILRSKLNRLKIQLWRGLEHVYRLATGKPRVIHSQITPNLFLGGQYGRQGLKRLKDWGVTAVVSMRSREPRPYNLVPWLEVLHLPTRDRQAPTVKHLKEGIKFIREEIGKEGKVYVHCFWGEGRGPTMALAFLIAEGLTLDDALAEVKRVRTFVKPTKVQLCRLRELELLLSESQENTA